MMQECEEIKTPASYQFLCTPCLGSGDTGKTGYQQILH